MVKIYTLSDPQTNTIRYVGKTSSTLESRLSGHITLAKKGLTKYHSSRWIKSLLLKGLIPKIELIEEVEDSQWEVLEIYWIEQFRQWGFKLTNIQKGGTITSTITPKSSSYLEFKRLENRVTIEVVHNIGAKLKFNSIQEASIFTKVSEKNIRILCKSGKKDRISKYKFNYINENECSSLPCNLENTLDIDIVLFESFEHLVI